MGTETLSRLPIQDEEWRRSYAAAVLLMKKVSHDLAIKRMEATLDKSYGTIYRAVAFDIDGTLTVPNAIELDIRVVDIIRFLLQKGVHVILITGRGRSSTRDAAIALRQEAKLSSWYYRRLTCITHNGCYLLTTPSDAPRAFLSNETMLIDNVPPVDEIFRRTAEVVRGFGTDVEVTKEPASVRISFPAEADYRSTLKQTLESLVSSLEDGQGNHPVLCRGSYGRLTCFEITVTNKALALGQLEPHLGVRADQIIRIGDHGEEGGNDFELLDCPFGFSVGTVSQSVSGCIPILDDKFAQLSGVLATRQLLDSILLFPPVSVIPRREVFFESLLDFERLAIDRARSEGVNSWGRISAKLSAVLGQTIEPNDHRLLEVYDQWSGAVRFREWEWERIRKAHPGRKFFDTRIESDNDNDEAKHLWSMFTDTAMVLRGPGYYHGLVSRASPATVTTFLERVDKLLDGGLSTIEALQNDSITPELFKLLLGFLDNTRNILLLMTNLAYSCDEVRASSVFDPGAWTLTAPTYRLLQQHTKLHYRWLFDAGLGWTEGLAEYAELVNAVKNFLVDSHGRLINEATTIKEPEKAIRRWRECDNFVQNVNAVRLGMTELLDRTRFFQQKITVCGLLYGGLELPAIASTFNERPDITADSALTNISIYHDKKVGRRVREGDRKYFLDQFVPDKRVCALPGLHGQPLTALNGPSIIADDNTTTGVTLQLARDLVSLLGSDVIGAIVVRFPSVNRFKQMEMEGHGAPDPTLLFSFIRGLVAPSPYSRLMQVGKKKNPYVDQTGVFDKSRARIERYLTKNGTPPKRD